MKFIVRSLTTLLVLATVLLWTVAGVVFYEMAIRPDKEYKREQEAKRDALEEERAGNLDKVKQEYGDSVEPTTELSNPEVRFEVIDESYVTWSETFGGKQALNYIYSLNDADLVSATLLTVIKSDNYFNTNKIKFYDKDGKIVEDYATKSDVLVTVGTLKKLVKVDDYLNDRGFRLVIWVGYRDNDLQQKLRDHLKITTGIIEDRYDLVAKPGTSNHQLGTAVDVTMETLEGVKIDMPSDYLDFSDNRLPSNHRENVYLQLLQSAMVVNGMEIYEGEWWHFNDSVKKYESTKQ